MGSQAPWHIPCIWLCCPWYCCGAIESVSNGWRPGDTVSLPHAPRCLLHSDLVPLLQLLHWAVRRGAATSDETLLALLEAGYDPDAHNLGCPCCCCFSTTARSMAEGTHAALLEHLASDSYGISWGKVLWEYSPQLGRDVAMQIVDGVKVCFRSRF